MQRLSPKDRDAFVRSVSSEAALSLFLDATDRLRVQLHDDSAALAY